MPSLTVTSLTVTFTGTVPPVPNTVILPVALSTTAASVFKDSNSTLTLFNSVTVLPNWFLIQLLKQRHHFQILYCFV